MKVRHLSFYSVMILVNILPFLPLPIKGILGLLFIIVSCIKIGFIGGLVTASLWTVFGFVNFFLSTNIDYRQGLWSMVFGTIIFYLTAFCVGRFVQTVKDKNEKLKEEVERRRLKEKEAEEKLALFQSLMDTIPSPIFLKDLNYRFIRCNRAFETAMGVKEEEVIGKTSYTITPMELADLHHKKDTEVIQKSSRQTYESNVRFADGQNRSIIFDKAIFTGENGKPAGIVGVMTDITDKKEVGKFKECAQENQQKIEEMLELDKMKTEFLSNVSHEFRTPLNVVLGSVQLLELYANEFKMQGQGEKALRHISIMKQNCYRLLKLVNNLIDISKIEAKAFELHLKNCNIVSVVEEITLSVSDYIENKGLKLIFDTETEEKIVACDEEKIERILLNLLSNAVKFTPSGGTIFVKVYDKDLGVYITVRDNGIGIPEDKQTQIFQRFYQVDEMFTRKQEGSGIGLSLVKSLVEMHGGTISCKSKEGQGTSFMIYLPARKVKEKKVYGNPFIEQSQIERISVEFSDVYSMRS